MAEYWPQIHLEKLEEINNNLEEILKEIKKLNKSISPAIRIMGKLI